MKSLFTLVALLTIPSIAHAQTPTDYILKFYIQGGTTALMTNTLPATGMSCGQVKTPLPPGTQVNPTKIAFDDPADSTKDCVYVDAGTGPLFALPFGTQTYTATLAARNIAGTSAESAMSNLFQRLGAVAATITGLRILR